MRRWILLLALLAACAPDRHSSDAQLFVAGELRGYLEPCGCNRPQLGGLARRGTALGGAAFVENGDLVSGPGRLNEIRFETLLTALSTLGCRALNIGDGELSLGIDFLRSAGGLARFPLLSANVIDESGKTPFPAWLDLDDWRVIGVLDPASSGGRAVLPVLPAIRSALADTPDGLRVLVLFHGPLTAARQALERFPGIDRMVFTAEDARVVSERLVTPGDRGRHLVRLGRTSRVLALEESYKPDPRMVASLAEYVRRIGAEDLLRRMNPETEPAAGGYAGDAACAKCHAEASVKHEPSRHARAIRSLAATGREIDPGCVGCHVVGYGERTGFLSHAETPELARVGCESCHGPGRAHSDAPKRKTPGDAKASCTVCHTEDTDPAFRFEEKWRAIEHR